MYVEERKKFCRGSDGEVYIYNRWQGVIHQAYRKRPRTNLWMIYHSGNWTIWRNKTTENNSLRDKSKNERCRSDTESSLIIY